MGAEMIPPTNQGGYHEHVNASESIPSPTQSTTPVRPDGFLVTESTVQSNRFNRPINAFVGGMLSGGLVYGLETAYHVIESQVTRYIMSLENFASKFISDKPVEIRQIGYAAIAALLTWTGISIWNIGANRRDRKQADAWREYNIYEAEKLPIDDGNPNTTHLKRIK